MIDASRGFGLFALTDHVVVVTGATGGIGVEVARALSAAGAQVGLNGRRTAPLEDLALRFPAVSPCRLPSLMKKLLQPHLHP